MPPITVPLLTSSVRRSLTTLCYRLVVDISAYGGRAFMFVTVVEEFTDFFLDLEGFCIAWAIDVVDAVVHCFYRRSVESD